MATAVATHKNDCPSVDRELVAILQPGLATTGPEVPALLIFA
jgi:hypothetical protein